MVEMKDQQKNPRSSAQHQHNSKSPHNAEKQPLNDTTTFDDRYSNDVQFMASQVDNPALPTIQRQTMAKQLQHLVGNQQAQQLIQTKRLPDSPTMTLQRDDPVEVGIVEVPTHPGDISEIVTDTLRTTRGCLMNFQTALDNFETRITNDSGEEAAPKDPAMIALQQVGTFVLGQLRSQIASAVPGGSFANSIVSLGQSIEQAIVAERRRSVAATERNAAANFVIRIRSLINTTAVDLESTMTEDVISVRERYDQADSDGHRDAIRFHQELINSQVTQMLQTTFSTEAIFTRIVEAWINENQSPSGGQARVWINMDRGWTAREAYLAAPFGSRLAEQLEQQGSLDLINLHVPRTVQWFPFYGEDGGGLVRCMADIDVDNHVTNIRAMGIQSGSYLQEFTNLVSTTPIPPTTQVNGSRVQ
ncbi:MAG: hypothetical protein RLP44_24465 [Aggregatilineales bacterium]